MNHTETHEHELGYHLAVIHQPYIDMILDGTKTIESRFTKIKCPPYKKVHTGDVVYMKKNAGMVLGQFTVAGVETYDNLDCSLICELYRKHFNDIFEGEMLRDKKGNPQPPEKWLASKYASLIHVEHAIKYTEAINFPKKDGRAWVILKNELDIKVAKSYSDNQ